MLNCVPCSLLFTPESLIKILGNDGKLNTNFLELRLLSFSSLSLVYPLLGHHRPVSSMRPFLSNRNAAL